jgi:hypothetical protein
MPPLKLREVWAIRIRLQIAGRLCDPPLQPRHRRQDPGCDPVSLRVNEVLLGERVRPHATVLQRKTGRPVQFELTEQTRGAVMRWITQGGRKPGDHLFPSRIGGGRKPITTCHFARLMDGWVGSVGLDPGLYGTHSPQRKKVALICRRIGNLRAVQLLFGHTKIESTVPVPASRWTTPSPSPRLSTTDRQVPWRAASAARDTEQTPRSRGSAANLRCSYASGDDGALPASPQTVCAGPT